MAPLQIVALWWWGWLTIIGALNSPFLWIGGKMNFSDWQEETPVRFAMWSHIPPSTNHIDYNYKIMRITVRLCDWGAWRSTLRPLQRPKISTLPVFIFCILPSTLFTPIRMIPRETYADFPSIWFGWECPALPVAWISSEPMVLFCQFSQNPLNLYQLLSMFVVFLWLPNA